MINKVMLIGRLTRDVESGATANGVSFARFSLAVQRSFANEQGVKEADFINCVAWRGTADVITKYVKKGDLFSVVGRLQTRSYQDQNGNNRVSTDVLVEDFQFINNNNSGNANTNSNFNQNFNNNNGNYNQSNQSQSNSFNNNNGFNNQNQNNNFSNNKSEEDLLNDFETGFNLDDDVPF